MHSCKPIENWKKSMMIWHPELQRRPTLVDEIEHLGQVVTQGR